MRIGNREVNLTNLEKVFFPRVGLRKGDLIHYYLDVADLVLNHVRRRLMQMLRWPNGVEGEFFYQKGSSMQKEHASADTGGRRCPQLPPSPPPTSSWIRSSSGTRRAS